MYYEIVGTKGRSPLHVKDNGNSLRSSFNKGRLRGNKVSLGEDIQNQNTLMDVEIGEIDIVLSWLEMNKDRVNYINMDSVCTKESCLELVRDYIRDEETPQKKHFRLK